MIKNRFFLSTVMAVVFNCLVAGAALGSFGFGGDDLGKSGLDFNKGYDVNTVATISGRVVSSPRTDEKEQVFVDVKAGSDFITLSLGRKSSWEKREIPLRANDEIDVKGSKAQGKDGKTYLLVQKITNRTTGSHAIVRNERGGPPWVGSHGGGMMSNGPGSGMMRGGGMMRH